MNTIKIKEEAARNATRNSLNADRVADDAASAYHAALDAGVGVALSCKISRNAINASIKAARAARVARAAYDGALDAAVAAYDAAYNDDA